MENQGLAVLGRELQGLQQDAERISAAADMGMAGAAGAGAPGFEQMLRRVDAQDQQAQTRMEAVERGESDDLVGAMLSSQQANLSFQMLLQVRNKVMGAVDDLIKLQF
ncbi:MAG: flagellar hook-basal body complex protein FliE [Paucibacter sp.]|nr:flagellar hook-basal body complex protein FliE [Roseateles sp.]